MVTSECKNSEELIQTRMDGELDAAGISRLEKHLAECAPCRKIAQEYELLDQSLSFHIKVTTPLPELAEQPQSITESLMDYLKGIISLIKNPPVLQHRYTLAVATVAVILLAVAVPVFLRSGSPVADGPETIISGTRSALAYSIKSVRPQVRVQSSSGEKRDLTKGENTSFSDNDQIVTDATGAMELAYNSGSTIKIGAGSRVKLIAAGLNITAGNVWMHFVQDGTSFEMTSPTAKLGVTGTKFGMKVEVDGQTSAFCEDGTIWVKGIHDQTKTFVQAGFQVAISPGGRAGTVAIFVPPSTRTRPGSQTETGTTPAVSPGTSPTPFSDIVDDTGFIFDLFRKHHKRNPRGEELGVLLKALKSGKYTKKQIERAIRDREYYKKLYEEVGSR